VLKKKKNSTRGDKIAPDIVLKKKRVRTPPSLPPKSTMFPIHEKLKKLGYETALRLA
jgi:hypothetical protein